MRIHLGMMVKDREASVGRALASASGLVDGYTILDTGSTDRTREVCAAFGRVRDVPWVDDYGAMRNAVMDACREDGADWYFMLDSDEEITDRGDFADVVRAAVEGDLDAVMVNCVPVMNHGRQPSEPNFRLIRTDRDMRWKYAYDEQLIGWRSDRVGFSTLSLDQDYCRDFTDAHEKRRGYLEPLRQRSAPGSDEWAHATYFLMRSYQSVRDFTTAEDYARDLVARKPKALGLATAWTTAARCAMMRGDVSGAWDILQRGTKVHPGLADLWHLIAVLAVGQMDGALADPGPYFATAQIASTVRDEIPSALRALGCLVELQEVAP